MSVSASNLLEVFVMVKNLSDMLGLTRRARDLVRKWRERDGTSEVVDVIVYFFGSFEFIFHGNERDIYPVGDF